MLVLWAMNVNDTMHYSLSNILNWFTLQVITWDKIALSGAIGVLGVWVSLFIATCEIIRRRGFSSIDRSGLISILAIVSGIFGIVFVTGYTIYLDWYLFLPSILIVFGATYLIEFNKITAVLYAVIISVAFSASLPDIKRRIELRREVIHELIRSEVANQHFEQTMLKFKIKCHKNPLIATDLLVAWMPNTVGVQISHARDAATYIFEQKRGVVPPSLMSFYGKSADFSQTTHLVLNKYLADKNESPLINLSIIMKSGNTYKFQDQLFETIDESNGRLLLQSIKYRRYYG